MTPDTRSVLPWVVYEFDEMIGEEVFVKFDGLRNDIHYSNNIKVDKTIFFQVYQLFWLDDFFPEEC